MASFLWILNKESLIHIASNLGFRFYSEKLSQDEWILCTYSMVLFLVLHYVYQFDALFGNTRESLCFCFAGRRIESWRNNVCFFSDRKENREKKVFYTIFYKNLNEKDKLLILFSFYACVIFCKFFFLLG